MTDSLSSAAWANARRVLIVVNSMAGAGKRHQAIQPLLAEFEKRGLEFDLIDSLSALSPIAQQLLDAGQLRAVVAAGGDGTVNEIVNRIGPEIPIAVFPLGTENLLAKYLQTKADPRAFAELIDHGKTVLVDAGRANGRLFLLMASVGFDAEVVRSLHAQRDGNINHWSYAKPIWQTIRSYEYPELRVDVSSNSIHCRWAFVFNLPNYGGGLKFAPDADPADGQLDLCAFERGGFISGLKYLAAIKFGRHQNLPTFTSWRGTQLSITAQQPVAYELDGDPGGMLPLTIEIIPKRVRLFVPSYSQTKLDPTGTSTRKPLIF